MAVGALFRDAHGRVLIVQPTYRPEWLIPGGALERDDSPRDACIREVNEELGLTVAIDRILCIDYRPADGAKSECVHFIFDGGVLHNAQIAAITLPPDELQACASVPIDVHLARRVRLAHNALQNGQTVYAEDGVVCG
jgi:8-oxo-dGTP pyrophosphatase MutT (NUDIX family)